MNDKFTVTNLGHTTMGKVGKALDLCAQKRSPRTILAKEKRVSPSKKPPGSPKIGKPVSESNYWPPPPIPNKEEFKYWKPWTVE